MTVVGQFVLTRKEIGGGSKVNALIDILRGNKAAEPGLYWSRKAGHP